MVKNQFCKCMYKQLHANLSSWNFKYCLENWSFEPWFYLLPLTSAKQDQKKKSFINLSLSSYSHYHYSLVYFVAFKSDYFCQASQKMLLESHFTFIQEGGGNTPAWSKCICWQNISMRLHYKWEWGPMNLPLRVKN